MKQIFILILAFVWVVAPLKAEDPKGNSSSKQIELEFRRDQSPPIILRAPMRTPVEAYYDEANQTLNVVNITDANGEVFLYNNGNISGHDTEINTSFQITAPGLYKIEIIGENWVAEGFFEV